ncbi:MAG TPA: hypothetical protein PLD88_00415, partial [Candidatus Berkiella sp.]|nr:hypothetical protein [Candidatus Berkiella sp.]
ESEIKKIEEDKLKTQRSQSVSVEPVQPMPMTEPAVSQPEIPKALTELKMAATKINVRFQVGSGKGHAIARTVLAEIEKIQKLNSPEKETKTQEYIEALSKSDNAYFKGVAQKILGELKSQD